MGFGVDAVLQAVESVQTGLVNQMQSMGVSNDERYASLEDLRFDLEPVTAIKFDSQGPYKGLNAVVLSLEGAGAVVQMLDAKGNPQPVPPFASIVTSLSLDDLNAAATALRAACPGA